MMRKPTWQLLALTVILYLVSCTKEEPAKEFPPIQKKGAVILDDELGSQSVKWPQNHNIKIAFMNGTKEQHEFVKKYAAIWDELTNLSFVYQDSLPGSEVRISFDPKIKSGKSFVGYKNNIKQKGTTMWLAEYLGKDGIAGKPSAYQLGTLRHEFGHMLGLIHEHLRSDSDIQWVDSAKRKGDSNIIDSATLAKYLKTPYDRTSIMHYSVSAFETLDSTTVGQYSLGGELSQIDKDFIQSVYPNASQEQN
jgi:hypothetical protein